MGIQSQKFKMGAGEYLQQGGGKMARETSELITLYEDRFINQHRLWFKQYVTIKGKCGYAYQKPDMDIKYGAYEPVTENLITRHFDGDITCAWSAVDEHFKSRWLCFDEDSEG